MFNEKERELLRKLRERAKKAVLIVEGKKDKLALKSLRIDADFFLLCRQNRSIPESAEKIAEEYDKAILMLDQDKQGKIMEKKMTTYLQRFGVKVNRKLGRELLRLADSPTVEGISGF